MTAPKCETMGSQGLKQSGFNWASRETVNIKVTESNQSFSVFHRDRQLFW